MVHFRRTVIEDLFLPVRTCSKDDGLAKRAGLPAFTNDSFLRVAYWVAFARLTFSQAPGYPSNRNIDGKLSVLTLFGSDEDNAGCGAGTINGRRSAVFQHFDGFDVVWLR